MIRNLLSTLERALRLEPELHPIDQKAAKYWVKQRLIRIFPELKDDPKALEQAYRGLNLQPRHGAGEGGETVFEITLPGKL